MISQDRSHFKIRLEPKVKQAVSESAAVNRRSMTAEINDLLERALKVAEPAAGNTLPG